MSPALVNYLVCAKIAHQIDVGGRRRRSHTRTDVFSPYREIADAVGAVAASRLHLNQQLPISLNQETFPLYGLTLHWCYRAESRATQTG